MGAAARASYLEGEGTGSPDALLLMKGGVEFSAQILPPPPCLELLILRPVPTQGSQTRLLCFLVHIHPTPTLLLVDAFEPVYHDLKHHTHCLSGPVAPFLPQEGFLATEDLKMGLWKYSREVYFCFSSACSES